MEKNVISNMALHILMTTLILALHLVVIIIVVREFKRWVDTKCQENFDCGMKWQRELSKIEMELESNEIYRKIVVKK
jgi:hypothetical protein